MTTRVLRGGSWLNSPWFLRSASRFSVEPVIRNYNRGFRVTARPDTYRMFRGGAWGDGAYCARSACRYHHDSGARPFYMGFRVVVRP